MVAAFRDVTIVTIPPAITVAPCLMQISSMIIITFEIHNVRIRGEFDGMVVLALDFSSLGKLAILINLVINGNQRLSQILKVGRGRTSG